MQARTGLVVAAFAMGLAAPMFGASSAFAQCSHGERIDGSTAGQAQSSIQRAGYENVRDLKKGCDNFWHAKATQNGGTIGVVLSPAGVVLVESLLEQPPGLGSTAETTYPQPASSLPTYYYRQ